MMETTTRKPILIPPAANTFPLGPNTFDKTESEWFAEGDASQAQFTQGSYRASMSLNYAPKFQLDILVALSSPARQYFRAIAKRLLEDHPGIAIDPDVKDIPT